MSDSPIEHVSDTAFWVATYRANEGTREGALFSDPLAARLVEGRGRAIAEKMSGARMTAWVIALRTCIIDDYLRAAIAGGCDCVLNLGAGLDTRPYRLELPPSLTWIEVDFPAPLDFKEQRLAGETPRCQLQRVRVDLSDASQRRKLFSEIKAQKVFVLTEGVIPYLSNEDVAGLAADLQAQPHFAFWVLEYSPPSVTRVARILAWRRRRQLANAPIRFKPDDWQAFFGTRGWAIKEIRSFADEARRRHRPFPLPRWARPILRLIARGRQRYGYALLGRRE